MSELRIAIAGLGTVGCGVVDIITQQAELLKERTGVHLRISAVSARDASKDRGINLSGIAWEEDALTLATRDDVDVVIELIGGADGIAHTLCETALKAGKHVITANKALVAHHGAPLAALAQAHKVAFACEAAVAGGIPIIKLIKEGLAANAYGTITGILNGTCNYILSTMEQTGRDFEDVLAEAQALGYAETEPSFDVDGIDASHKIAILSSMAYGTLPAIEQLTPEGIRSITARDIEAASELGCVIRLIGVTERTDNGIRLAVHPALIPHNHVLAGVHGVDNAVHVHGDAVGEIFIKGPGAGRAATASSVVADIMDVARSNLTEPLLTPNHLLTPAAIIAPEACESTYYLRLCVRDDAGVLAGLTHIINSNQVSVADMVQHKRDDGLADIIFTTHPCKHAHMVAVRAAMTALESVHAEPHMLRMLSA